MQNIWQNAVRGLSKLTDGAAMGANVVGTLLVLVLVVVVNYDVFSRELFNSPFRGAIEVVQFAMALIVFLQLPDVVRVGRLTRSDGFLAIVGSRWPKFASALRRAIDALSAVFMALVAVAVWPVFLEMFASQDYFGVPGVFTAPWWPIKLVTTLSAGLCAVIFVLKILSPIEPPKLIRAPELEDPK